MKRQSKISLDVKLTPDKGYKRGNNGYDTDAGLLAFGTAEDWVIGKVRKGKTPHPNLF